MKLALGVLIAMAASAAVVYNPASCSTHPCTVTITCALATCTAGESAEIQTVLDNAAVTCSDTIELQAGRTWTGDWTFSRTISCAGNPLTIRTTAVSSLPALGSRIQPAYAVYMPTLAGSGNSVFNVSRGTGIVIRGIQFSPATSITDGLRVYANSFTLADLPDQIEIQQVMVRSTQARNGFLTESRSTIVRDSFIEAWSFDLNENKALVQLGPGPFTARNNYLSGGSIHVLIGGTSTVYRPECFILNNTFFRPTSLLTANVLVKNGLETKDGTCQIANNHFDNTYQGNDQIGQVIAINSREGGPVYSATADPATDNLTSAGNTIQNNDRVFVSGTTIPGGLTGCTAALGGCFAINVSGSTLQLSATQGGAALNITTTGSGVLLTRQLANCGSYRMLVTGNYSSGSYSALTFLQSDPNVNHTCKSSGVVVQHNAMAMLNSLDRTPPSGVAGTAILLSGGGNGLAIRRNTIYSPDSQVSGYPPARWLANMGESADPAEALLVIDGNIAPAGDNWIKASGLGFGGASIDGRTTAARVTNNIFGGGSALTCAGGRTCTPNQVPTGAEWDGGIVDYEDAAVGDYRLAETSPYRRTAAGEPAGADMSLVSWMLATATGGGGSIQLNYTLSPAIRQSSCGLELSNSVNLINRPHNASYTLLPVIDPAITPRIDQDDGSNANVTRTTLERRRWTVTGISAGTVYWSLVCGPSRRTGSVLVQ